MRAILSWFRGQRPNDAPPDAGPGPGPAVGPRSVRSLFHNFHRLLEHNTDALEVMAGMERALGGEFIFDQTFLRTAAREMGRLTQRTVHRLNGLTGERHLDLYDRYQALHDHIEDILAGGMGPEADSLTLAYDRIGWETEPLVGTANACLAELHHHFRLPAPDGFAVTVAGVRAMTAAAVVGPVGAQGPGMPTDAKGHAEPGVSEGTGAALPDALAQAVRAEADALFRRRGRPCALVAFLSPVGSFAVGARETEIAVPTPAGLPAALCALAVRVAHERSGPEGADGPPMALGVSETLRSVLGGTVRTLDRSAASRDLLCVLAAAPDEPDNVERYFLGRSHPCRLVRSDILPKPVGATLPDGNRSLSYTAEGLRRGSALLASQPLIQLAESAMAVERILGAPQDIQWACDAKGRLLFTHVHALARSEEPEDLSALLDAASVLVRGGTAAQAGVAAGRVIHVREDDDPDTFPLGAVAVARVAAPRLAGVLRRASALVTEVGTAVGHLATIAREYRVPALFGLPGALAALPQGGEVTVDAGEGVVYQGVLEPLLRYQALGPELDPADPEYAMLRRLLRRILPLNLLDPESPDFRAARCRTYHDVIHFAHEKAVEELADIQGRHPGLHGAAARRLVIDVPMDMRVLDTGGGVDPDAGSELRPASIACLPLRAFLQGLSLRAAWDTNPAQLSAGDVIGGLRRTFELMNAPAASVGSNLAIVSRDTMNLSLRLGYHFSVIDAHLADNPNHNTAYFRFVGGLADRTRKERRARLIVRILEGLGFLADSKGDLVIGKIKGADRADLEAVMARLGELTAFTRQMDTAMHSDRDVERLGRVFLGLEVPGDSAAEEGA